MYNLRISARQLMKASTLCGGLLITCCMGVSAQHLKIPAIHSDRFSIGIDVGLSGNWASGGGIKESINEFKATGDGYKGTRQPLVRPLITALVDYRLNDNFSVRGGIRFTKRGYSFKLKGGYSDSVYQYDQEYRSKQQYKVSLIELPFSVKCKLNDNISLLPAFLVGTSLKSTAKYTLSIAKKTIINGAKSDEESVTVETGAAEHARSFYLGFMLGAEYKLHTNIYADLSLQRIMNYAQFNGKNLSDNSIVLSVKYMLPIN
jgi:opacity protein-like surface antigen